MKSNKTKQLTMLAILVAVTVVLQTISAVIAHFGYFSISLTMIPLVVAVWLLGMKGGLVIGGTFGATVLLHCILGLDAGGALLFEENWLFTIIATIIRGLIAGALTALVYYATKRIENTKVRIIITAACAPVFNTGIFVLMFATLFNTTLNAWADASDFNGAFSYVILGLVGINFVLEFISTVLLAPPVCMAVNKMRKSF